MAVIINGYTMSDADLKRRQEMLDSTGDVVRPANRAMQLRVANIRSGSGPVYLRKQLLEEDRMKQQQQQDAARMKSSERQQMMQSVTGPAAVEARRAAGLAEVARIEGRSAVEQKRIEGLTAIQQEQEKAKSAPKFQIAQPGSALVDTRTGEMGAQVPYKPEPEVSNTLTPAIDASTGKAIPGLFIGSDGKQYRVPMSGVASDDPLGGGAAPAAQGPKTLREAREAAIAAGQTSFTFGGQVYRIPKAPR